MDLRFKEGERFIINGDEEYEIVNIDYSDEEYPYECYPVEFIELTKHILENGVFQEENDFGDRIYKFVDEGGDVYEFTEDDRENGWRSMIEDFFIDDRMCAAESEIYEYKLIELTAKNEELQEKVDELDTTKSFLNKNLLVELLDKYTENINMKEFRSVEFCEKLADYLVENLSVDESREIDSLLADAQVRSAETGSGKEHSKLADLFK